MSGVKGIIGMHRFNICLVVVLLRCENTINVGTSLRTYYDVTGFVRPSKSSESLEI